MAIYALYSAADKSLYSWTRSASDYRPDYADAGFGLAVLGDDPDPGQGAVWNTGTLSFDPPPPAPVYIEPDDFVAVFTPTETARIYASADPVLQQFLRRLAVRRLPVDLLGETVTQGLAYIAHLGLFDDQNGVADAATTRPAAIQAWRPA
jgi:hypothetical protein